VGAVAPVTLLRMKATISVPGETLRRVDGAARQLGISRSEFFARAADRWLDALDDDTTAAINEAIASTPSDHAFTDAAAAAVR
jgi:metal-responsive CopG/Arc/MetJ family transcriptional regulator